MKFLKDSVSLVYSQNGPNQIIWMKTMDPNFMSFRRGSLQFCVPGQETSRRGDLCSEKGEDGEAIRQRKGECIE